MKKICLYAITLLLFILAGCSGKTTVPGWTLNDKEYLERPGLTVLSFHDYYPVGKQGGIEIIQHGERIASNGFIRMQTTGGKRLEYPENAIRETDSEKKQIKTAVSYVDLGFKYSVRVFPDGENIKLSVDLEKPIPKEWDHKLTFELEFYPPLYYGKTFRAGESFGIIPRQINGYKVKDSDGTYKVQPMGAGRNIILAGEDPERKVVISSQVSDLILVDNRNSQYSGWIGVKSEIPAGATENAVEWTISPSVVNGWIRKPVVEISQAGYHPDQRKQAVIELDKNDNKLQDASLLKVSENGNPVEVFRSKPVKWGSFLCYDYAVFDFSSVKEPGMYTVKYGDNLSYPFPLSTDVFRNNTWQPALLGYFPVQMCHIRVKDRSLIWHGACHMDDALQAPASFEHIDGYTQLARTETSYQPVTTVPYLNQGGWHDAGDNDLAAGSQAMTTHYLALACELNDDRIDQTSVSYDKLLVEMYKPDGIPDFVQQVKHGVLNLLSGYRASGHSFTGIIANLEWSYLTGDWGSQTDQLFYDTKLRPDQKTATSSGVKDDRWVFTNRYTAVEYQVTAALAAASRILKGYDEKLAAECIETAKKTWNYEQNHEPATGNNAYVPGNITEQEIIATSELLYSTGEDIYADHLIKMLPEIGKNLSETAWSVARVSERIKDEGFNRDFRTMLSNYKTKLDSTLATNPFGVPWRPAIWGVGWDIQEFALKHYYLVQKFPDMFDKEMVFRVVSYVLGCHPGSGTSLVSGVGSHSVTVAFGLNRDMEYYIPGGMVSGTALIRPDFPELKETTPYLWQQSEYVMSGASTYIFCVIAADKLLNN